MKVTERKAQANRNNASQSLGPQTVDGKRWASQNSRTYGFFAKSLRFDSEEEAAEYRTLLTDLTASFTPMTTGEELLVGRLAIAAWNDRKVLGLLQRQLGGYERSQLDTQLARFFGESSLPEVEIPGMQQPGGGAQAAKDSPWECREMVLKVTNEHHELGGRREARGQEADLDSDRKADGFYVEVRVGHAIDTLLRCHVTFERSFERTLNQLLKLQARGGK